MLSIAGLTGNSRICDIGAGVAHLTIPLASRGFIVDAVEPNDSMRRNGIKRTIKDSKLLGMKELEKIQEWQENLTI